MKLQSSLILIILSILTGCNHATSNGFQVEDWTAESTTAEVRITQEGKTVDIVSPDGLTWWYNKPVTGRYEISYRIMVVMEQGEYDRLSDMNCFWGAKDPKHPQNLFAQKEWRGGNFAHYNSLNLFYVGYGGNENKTTRFRQYHGDRYGQEGADVKPLLKEYTGEQHLLKPNHWYEIVITATGETTSFACDGKVLFTLQANTTQTDGHFAIRLWKNHVKVKDFKIKVL